MRGRAISGLLLFGGIAVILFGFEALWDSVYFDRCKSVGSWSTRRIHCAMCSLSFDVATIHVEYFLHSVPEAILLEEGQVSVPIPPHEPYLAVSQRAPTHSFSASAAPLSFVA